MDLTEQEKLAIEKQLEELKNISKQDIDDIIKNKLELDSPNKENEIKKLTDSSHEIVFTINASVFTQNEKGELTGTKEVCVKNYHIPVPIDKNYNSYMSVFFDYLEKKIIDTIQDTNRDAKDIQEN